MWNTNIYATQQLAKHAFQLAVIYRHLLAKLTIYLYRFFVVKKKLQFHASKTNVNVHIFTHIDLNLPLDLITYLFINHPVRFNLTWTNSINLMHKQFTIFQNTYKTCSNSYYTHMVGNYKKVFNIKV